MVSLQPLGEAIASDSGYVATFQQVGLSGNDGIIVDEERCQIFLASAGLVVNLAQNLQLLEIWGDPPTPKPNGPRFKWFDLGEGPNHGAWESPMHVKQAKGWGWGLHHGPNGERKWSH